MLARARDEGQWHAAQSDAAGICFDVLALFPDCEEAKELVYQLFCDEWTLPSADEEIRRVRRENTKERTASYRPSIDPQLASLFMASIQLENEKSLPTLVDWSFLDKDDGQPGEPAEWVKKQMAMFADDEEIVDELMRMHRWTRNITPPAMPPRYDPNEPHFDPRDIFGENAG